MAIKPVISYQGISVHPFTLDNNAPIIKKKDGTKWSNKTELTDYVDQLYVHPSSDCYCFAECECGLEYSYMNKAAVPDSIVTCTCGRKIIEYA